MALLGPIIKTEDGWDWANKFPSGDWTRFTSYVKRVRSLVYCTTDQTLQAACDPICYGVPARWRKYAASHHGQYLLPEIRKIDWACNENDQLEMILSFLSPKIKDIRIWTGWDVYSKMTDRVLIALRTMLPPGVRVFQFIPHDSMEPDEEVSESIQSLVESLDELQEIRLPGQQLAPFMFKPGRLQVLEANCNLDSGIKINDILSQLADTCSLLEHLRILFWNGSNITFSDIRPLIRCSKLRSLDMEYTEKFNVDEIEIREMGGAWPELEALHIASRRRSDDSGDPGFGMPFSSLVLFADSFSPKLRKLGLYIDTQDIPAPPNPPVTFPNLEVFHVGSSELDIEKAKLAKAFDFLSALLPQGIEITTSDFWMLYTEQSVFGPGNRGPGRKSWNVLSRMLAQGETADILAELDQTGPWDVD
ncbi:hypothetical protein FRC00_004276 [Tulasnella sp. 408]|nr:hypothetical protein FRC00_004276 [Tulasnella sp. 408]